MGRRALLAALSLSLASITLVAPQTAGAVAERDPGGDAYRDQRLTWQKCLTELPPGAPPQALDLECTGYRVPADWNKPGQGGDDLVIVASRLRPSHGTPKGLLLTNPGGPGGPGLVTPLLLVNQTKLTAAMEIVGIDVRGTGYSTTVTCGRPDDAWETHQDPRDRTPTGVRNILNRAKNTAQACRTHSGALLDKITTEQTVKDLDLLRHLMGYDKTNWLGYSAGTWLGAAYATYFPNRVSRFVLDSNTEFTASWQESFTWFPKGLERRFQQDFAPWVARHHARFGLGGTAEQVRATYERLRAILTERPLDLGVLTLHAHTFDLVIAQGLYSKYQFQVFAELIAAIRQALEGGAAAAAPSPAALGLLNAAGAANAVAPDSLRSTQYAVVCNDTPWRGGPRELLRSTAELGARHPLLGWRAVLEPCAYWDRESPTLKPRTGEGVPPILMVQTAGDGPTPLGGALRALHRFKGARFLLVTDEGDHGAYAGGNTCVDRRVEAYLVDGVLPGKFTTCPGVPIPDPVDALAKGPAQQPNPILRNRGLTETLTPYLRTP
ncbi:alpha/beta hydrolase [Rhizohabitans arisaemae]|uniref:alpha/beta hydrolase n=1 Tax=Rhizohabitans arisaemae TaxID=2720610 RepID=UPI0024B202A0|nr:alpha/beta hydrolase [Rhizohabitans arisaemae]